jgi:hypothetical protein
MKYLMVALIRAYQRVAPRTLRERCIFAESCSAFVLRRTREGGAGAGLSALMQRVRRCRPGYFRLPPSPIYPEIQSPVRLADGAIVSRAELSPHLRL